MGKIVLVSCVMNDSVRMTELLEFVETLVLTYVNSSLMLCM
jgi:hypothetical protein